MQTFSGDPSGVTEAVHHIEKIIARHDPGARRLNPGDRFGRVWPDAYPQHVTFSHVTIVTILITRRHDGWGRNEPV